MRYATIEDIYTANERFRGKLLASISGISADEAAARPSEGGWCVAEIVEHLAAVEEGMGRIAAKLLREAEASTADNGSDEPWVREELVETFIRSADVKVEAPERVRPSGEMSIPDSLAKMDENKAFIDASRAARGQRKVGGHISASVLRRIVGGRMARPERTPRSSSHPTDRVGPGRATQIEMPGEQEGTSAGR